MSPEPTGVHGLLKQRKLFTHKYNICISNFEIHYILFPYTILLFHKTQYHVKKRELSENTAFSTIYSTCEYGMHCSYTLYEKAIFRQPYSFFVLALT